MKVNCYFERGALHWSNISAHNFVYNKLVEKYPEIEFVPIHNLWAYQWLKYNMTHAIDRRSPRAEQNYKIETVPVAGIIVFRHD